MKNIIFEIHMYTRTGEFTGELNNTLELAEQRFSEWVDEYLESTCKEAQKGKEMVK